MSLEQEIVTKISDVVTTWTDEGRMFTAFEISLAVKDQGVRERHRNLRDKVHETIFSLGGPKGYTRTLMDVGAPEQAWVYHPQTASPYRYRPLDRPDSDFQRPAANLSADLDEEDEDEDEYDSDVDSEVDAEDDDELEDDDKDVPALRNPACLVWGSPAQASVPPSAYGTDQRGRLAIPPRLLTALRIGPGSSVKVTCDDGRETLTIQKLGDAERVSPDAMYTAEPDGNLRLTQTTLAKAGIGGLQCYRVVGDAKAITVSAYED